MNWTTEYEDETYTSWTEVSNFTKIWKKYRQSLTQHGFSLFCQDKKWYLKFTIESPNKKKVKDIRDRLLRGLW